MAEEAPKGLGPSRPDAMGPKSLWQAPSGPRRAVKRARSEETNAAPAPADVDEGAEVGDACDDACHPAPRCHGRSQLLRRHRAHSACRGGTAAAHLALLAAVLAGVRAVAVQ